MTRVTTNFKKKKVQLYTNKKKKKKLEKKTKKKVRLSKKREIILNVCKSRFLLVLEGLLRDLFELLYTMGPMGSNSIFACLTTLLAKSEYVKPISLKTIGSNIYKFPLSDHYFIYVLIFIMTLVFI